MSALHPRFTPVKILVPLLALFTACASLALAAEAAKISPADAARRVADGKAVLVDIREPDEWAGTGVAAPAVLLPMSDLDEGRKLWQPFLEKNAGKELILYCHTGYRAAILAKVLADEGRTVASAGGIDDWIAAGLPLRKVERATPP